ncbi:GDSL family lipase [Christiangramia fulva]|uniref:GDSL family lipase n=1 Tax=Christiangramia fulva TaxID=2126553 RepID=A0A2R3Z2Y6_9FLAO|nr:SGNH/GDSL hydrolase family protein [Christiangramia fulva]AVR44608.1 GDSL family lipase [Christiangramia fulva]
MKYNYFFHLLICIVAVGCSEPDVQFKNFNASGKAIDYKGRVEKLNDSAVALISSAAFAETKVIGDSATLYLSSGNDQHHYVVVELNGQNSKRYKVDGSPISIDLGNNDTTLVRIFKANEALTGDVILNKISAQNLIPAEDPKQPLIEFIGNSITCGMGADTRELSCSEGEWYDHHNAYLAYGPRVARALNLDFRLSCVSGMGMYRNWNDEDQPVMPDVYENLRLNADSTKKADLSRKPDIVSIALGTNDLSFGDGTKERSDFDQQKFVENYTNFTKRIFELFPDTQVALLTSPMVGEKEQQVLLESLKQVKENLKNRPISIFEFDNMQPHGCDSHPDIDDHAKMAQQLIPFFKGLLKF